MTTKKITLIVPRNDLESVKIGRLAEKLGFDDIRVSDQPFGARLEKEPPEAFQNIAPEVWIVEIPGPETEKQLRERNHRVVTIDHHRYGDLDRCNEKSSMEQFADLCGYSLTPEEKLVAINDRAYIWGLIAEGADFETIRDIRREDLLAQGWSEDDFPANQEEYDSRRLEIGKHCRLREPFFVHETRMEKTTRFAELYHLPGRTQYLGYINTKNQCTRHNLLLIKKGRGLMIDFSGTAELKNKVMERFVSVSSKFWSGGTGGFGYAGMEIKKDVAIDGVRNEIAILRHKVGKLDSKIAGPSRKVKENEACI